MGMECMVAEVRCIRLGVAVRAHQPSRNAQSSAGSATLELKLTKGLKTLGNKACYTGLVC